MKSFVFLLILGSFLSGCAQMMLSPEEKARRAARKELTDACYTTKDVNRCEASAKKAMSGKVHSPRSFSAFKQACKLGSSESCKTVESFNKTKEKAKKGCLAKKAKSCLKTAGLEWTVGQWGASKAALEIGCKKQLDSENCKLLERVVTLDKLLIVDNAGNHYKAARIIMDMDMELYATK